MQKTDYLLDAYDVAHWVDMEGGIDFSTFMAKFCTDLDKSKDQDVFKAARRWRKLLKTLSEYGFVVGKNWGYGGFSFNAKEVKDKISAALDELALDEDAE